MAQAISHCRICGNDNLQRVLDLGTQKLTGIFPREVDADLTAGPLELVKCHGPAGGGQCGLLQLRHSFDLKEMYGDNYGYRSSLNRSMVDHLRQLAQSLQSQVPLHRGDLVLDIGSNDGTLLSFYPDQDIDVVGIDPTAYKFEKYYQPHIRRIPDFFTRETFQANFADRKARIVTSIAMFYDLPAPQVFANDVAATLADDGLWHLEQAYLPSMLDGAIYDSICHEHLQYYALKQIKFLGDRAGLKIVAVHFNDVNGGSFAVTMAKDRAPYPACDELVREVLRREDSQGLDQLERLFKFADDVAAHRDALVRSLRNIRADKKLILGYGASTKGNVVLQYCGITPEDLPFIAEVNEDKFGCYTPGTNIPIIPEPDARAMKPDYFLVFPWHFRDNILRREAAFVQQGGRFLLPFPTVHLYP